ncbi:glycosyltransferase family 4 protein [Sphingomonas sp. PAMC 26621]|uniref:glycosyltransferase family 4 protein n=1 Tax=Sphingomonas sp. PAMC 26621 TaxID=1112213 RepID=UPI00028882C5|nr:glycosyltransferase family 4 protein [Sphingomonas sp. PAMC 26621]
MKLAYLLNSYPMTSTTFIRGEIEQLEALGQPVKRFAVRHWEGQLLDPGDIAEQHRTEYLLTGNVARLIGAALLEPLVNLPGLMRTLPVFRHVLGQSSGGLAKNVNYLLQAIYLRRRARAIGIDHVHTHFSTNATTVALLARHLGGPTYSFTVHGPDELVEPKQNALGRKVADSAFTVAITRYCRGRILEEAARDADKVEIIPCGIDLTLFTPLREPGEAGRFVCVGRLCPNKAQTLIPAAVALVRAEFPHVMVDLIGDGEDRPKIEAEIARHDVQDHVRILGWADAAGVRSAIARSSALLLPSYAEGLPIVLMESLALGRPVLTTSIAGIPELVDGGCGWIYPSGSVEAIADALRSALRSSPEALMALGAEGRRRIEARHDATKSAQALQQNFQAVAQLPTPAAPTT